ncbi:MAG: PAS domain S-box protein [Candidatus Omnitrophota bacterium]
MSIRLKLTILFLAVSLVPLVLVSVVTFNHYKHSLQNAYLLRLEDLVISRASQIEQYSPKLKTPVTEADLMPLYRFIKNAAGLGATGEILVGKKQGGQFVYLNPLRHEPGAALNKVMDIGGALAVPMQEAVQGKAGAGELTDYRGKKVVAAWRYIPSLGWGIVAKIDAQEAYTEVENLRNLVFLILGIIFVLSGLAAFAIARSISRPINILARGAEIIGSGDLDYQIALGSGDELGQLAAAFDKMTRDLKVAGASRDAERQRLYGVLEALPVYVVLLSEDYHVPFANKFFRERFGESGGKRCYEYLFKRNEPCENCESYKAMKTNAPHHWEWTGPDQRNYDIYDFPFVDSDGSRMIMEMGIDVTAHKKAEAELKGHRDNLEALVKERTLELQMILDSMPSMVFYKDKQNNFIRVNRAFESAMGLTKKELEGKSVFDIYPQEQAEAFWKDDLEVINSGKAKFGIIEAVDTSEGTRIVETDKIPYLDAQGNVAGIVGFTLDVTERKRAEDALRESERRMQRAQDIAHLGSWELDLATNNLVWSDETYRIFGLQPQEFKATYGAFLEAVHPDDRAAVDAAYAGSLRDGKESYEIEHRIIRKANGEIRFIHEKCEHIRDGSGRIIRSVGMVHDITGRKRAEEALVKAHAELEQKVIERTSQLAKANELLSLEIVERQNIEREIRVRNSLLRLAAKSSSRKAYLDAVVRLLRGWSMARCAGIRLLGEDGKIPYESYVGFSREFWEKENRLSVKEDKCLCIRAITGEYREEDTNTVTPYGSFYCRDTGDFVAKLSEAQKSQLRGQCIREGFKSLTIIPIRFKDMVIGAIHLADEKKDLPGPRVINSLESLAMRVGEDITKFNLVQRREEAEEELIRTQIQLTEAKRLSDIGTLAATVAHELRNPLAAIQMASYNIRRKAQNPMLDKHLLTIENKVNESEQIISNLLFYSRLKAPQYENVGIHKIINECAAHAKNRFAKEKVSLRLDLSPVRRISIEADPLQMKEVFGNILNNAYESQTGETRRVEVNARMDNGYVEVTVKDAGEGIDKENLERIFDPFFTTKARGTGLGLTVCKQIINFHAGSIDIESEKGKGTLVSIKLPVRKEAA